MDELNKIKRFAKKHQTEILIVATVGTIYVSTIAASASLAGKTASKVAVKLALDSISQNPIIVDVKPEQVADIIVGAMKKAPKFNV